MVGLGSQRAAAAVDNDALGCSGFKQWYTLVKLGADGSQHVPSDTEYDALEAQILSEPEMTDLEAEDCCFSQLEQGEVEEEEEDNETECPPLQLQVASDLPADVKPIQKPCDHCGAIGELSTPPLAPSKVHRWHIIFRNPAHTPL
jgi:hypothetical protein